MEEDGGNDLGRWLCVAGGHFVLGSSNWNATRSAFCSNELRTGRTASNREQRRDKGERGLEYLSRHAMRKKRSRRDASYLLAGTQGILKL